jgi:hypothetical protein
MHMDAMNLQHLGSFDAILMDPPWRTARSNPNYPSVSVEELVFIATELCEVYDVLLTALHRVTCCSLLMHSFQRASCFCG